MTDFIRQAIALAIDNVRTGRGGPFAALVVDDSGVIAHGVNLVTSLGDPTAHAEVMAIRAACARRGGFHLRGCQMFTSCEPCPMCLGAIYWARLDRVWYAATRCQAAAAGFDDSLIYQEMELAPEKRRIPMMAVPHPDAGLPFAEWLQSAGKTPY